MNRREFMGTVVGGSAPQAKPATEVRFYAPGTDDMPIDFRMAGAEAVFTAPPLHAYGMIVVNW